MKDRITIVLGTHLIRSAPSTIFIEKTLEGVMKADELKGCRKILGFDLPEKESARSTEYKKNIENLGIEVFTVPHTGQRKNFVNVISKVETDYFIFLENDWWFLETPDWEKIIKAMDNHSHISTVYFNKRPNIKHINEKYLEEDTTITECSMLKTSKWSNNPYIARSKKWKDEWIPLFNNSGYVTKEMTNQMENLIHPMYKKDIKNLGFSEAHSKWGMYSYGKLGKNKMVLHLDASYRIENEKYCLSRLEKLR